MEALIIPPVTEKTTYFRNETVGRVWWEAAQALRHAARVFVIGYALARSDLGMRAFLATILRDSPADVFFVDIDECAPGRYRDLIGPSSIRDAFVYDDDPVGRFAQAYCGNEV